MWVSLMTETYITRTTYLDNTNRIFKYEKPSIIETNRDF